MSQLFRISALLPLCSVTSKDSNSVGFLRHLRRQPMMPIVGGPPESLIGALFDGRQGQVARESRFMDEEYANPPLWMRDDASDMDPVYFGALAMEPVALPLLPGLGSVLDSLLDDGPIDIPSAVQRVRLRAGPDLAGRLAAPLDHITRPDGAEVIEGDLPKGLDKKGLLVEQRGDVVLIRHIVNHTMDGKGSIGIDQHIRLGFQPERKEKATYNPATGHFAMEFARPKNADFDPQVEVLFETPDANKENSQKNATPQGASSGAPTGSQVAKSQVAMDSTHNKTHAQGSHVSMLQLGPPMVKPDLIFEVGDEL